MTEFRHDKPHRQVRRADGVREVQEWTGPASMQGSDKDQNWRTVATLEDGETLGGFVKVATDVELAPHHKGGQAGLLRVGSTTHALSLEQLEGLGTAIAELVSDLKAAARERQPDDSTPAAEG